MVHGLDVFLDHFAGYESEYTLIGGVACAVALGDVGLEFRATKDLDIVLCCEALTDDFVSALWSFVRMGGYDAQETSEGDPRFYRFHRPSEVVYPTMLELFSRKPEQLELHAHSRLTPLPISESVPSLSAILLDDTYYVFLMSNRQLIDSVPIVSPDRLVPLKARAWLDLSGRQESGEKIDSRDIKKHKNDIFRLAQVLDPSATVIAPQNVCDDVAMFLSRVESDPPNLSHLGIRGTSYAEIAGMLAAKYHT